MPNNFLNNKENTDPILIFQNSMSAINTVVDAFEESNPEELNRVRKLELIMFCLFYSWEYIKEKDLVLLTAENAMMYIAIAFKNFHDTDKEIELISFHELYKERYVHYKTEFPKFLEAIQKDEVFMPQFLSVPLTMDDMKYGPEAFHKKSVDFIIHFDNLIKRLKYFLDLVIK